MSVFAQGRYRVFWNAVTVQPDPSWRRTVVLVESHLADGVERFFCHLMMIPARWTTIAVPGVGQCMARSSTASRALHDPGEQGTVPVGDLLLPRHDGAVERDVGHVRRVQGGVRIGVAGTPAGLEGGEHVEDVRVSGGVNSGRSRGAPSGP